MSAKMAPDPVGPIIHGTLMCENIRTARPDVLSGEGPQSSTIAARFWAKVDRRSADECWPWMAFCQPNGYGYIRINKRAMGAHRVAYELSTGKPAAGFVIRHKCDNPPCCNPKHLRRGSQRQNVQDAIRKRRHVNPNWRLRKTVRNGSMPVARLIHG